MKTHIKLAATAIAVAVGMFAPAIPARAATMSASSSAPVINDADIANYGDVFGTDKWFYSTASDGGARGQSIITGGAAVRHSSDLGSSDPWESAPIPNADSTVNDVIFDITQGATLNAVQATIPTSKAASGKLFGNLHVTEN